MAAQVDILIQGVLEKKKRKALQGYARRFFVLGSDGILRYSRQQGEKFRDSIDVKNSSIGRSVKNYKIVIDDGMKVFHCKVPTQEEFDKWVAAFHNFTQVKASSEHVREADSAEPQRSFSMPSASGLQKFRSDSSAAAPVPEEGGPHLINEKTAEHLVDLVTKMTVTIKKLENAANPTAPTSGAEEGGIASKLYNSVTSVVSAPKADPATITESISTLKEQHAQVLHLLESSRIVADSPHHVEKLQRAESLTAMSSSSSTEDLYHDAESYDFLDDDDVGGSSLSRIDSNASTDTSASSSSAGNSSSEDEGEGDYTDASSVKSDDTEQGKKSSKGGPALPESGSGHRRSQLPHPIAGDEVSLFGLLKKNMGKDLSKISFPVTLNEPLSQLQSMAEDLEYSELLDSAAKASDSLERLLYVTVFVVSGYSRYKYRGSKKPFNPMLGETFELVRKDKGFKFIAEKVEHHPNWTACYAEGRGWEYTGTASGAQKFWGRSYELLPEGMTEIKLRDSDEAYTVSRPPSFVRNIMSGEKYIEHVGDLTITCKSTGAKSKVSFKEGSSWGGASSRNKVEGKLESDSGEMEIVGKWDESISKKTGSKSSETVWTINEFPSDAPKYYGFTSFGVQLNEITPDLKEKLPPTDSRLRPDQRAFEDGKVDDAEDGKQKLEAKQRERRKEWEGKKAGAERPPQFFKQEGGDEWRYRGNYWERREKGDWNQNIKIFEM